MKFSSLEECVLFLEKHKELIRIKELVDPELEMAEITRRVFDAQGPALLFENIKHSKFRAVSNLFGTWQRTLKIFEPQLEHIKALVELRSDFSTKSFKKLPKALIALAHSLPLKSLKPCVLEHQCKISDLPMIKCWSKDGGAFILLPQVFSKDPEKNSIFSSNLGMYRIQLSGNNYIKNEEVGLHYQLQRGIGNHHKKAIEKNKSLRVSIFIGGPPAHTLSAVMPLPEDIPEIFFAGGLAGRNFRYAEKNKHFISADSDFCITGEIVLNKTKPEGPFGDHLGYYSLKHEYPYLKIDNVWHKKNAIFPFTIVGRPPQEDSNFGRLIHEITKPAIQSQISGVESVNAVDAAGVHSLLLVKAYERYLPYEEKKPRELLIHASKILGTGQLSLAKYLIICDCEDNPDLNVNNERAFLTHVLERVDLSSNLHFFTKTTMDTLDYSTKNINHGSKLVIATAGKKKRELKTKLPYDFSLPDGFLEPKIASAGIVVIKGPVFTTYIQAKISINRLKAHLKKYQKKLESFPLFVIVDNTEFVCKTFSNFLWVSFLRSNPSHDIYGVDERTNFKHWGCSPCLIIDARIKPFHTDVLEVDKKTCEKVDALCKKEPLLSKIV